jgi:hypothetical protein
MMAQFAVLSRLKEPENSSIFSKMRSTTARTSRTPIRRPRAIQEYRDYAGVDEGMNGLSTRFAFKILSKVFNFDHTEVAANPVHLMYVLEQQIEREQFPAELEQNYLHQGVSGAALCRVHRQGDPDRLPGELQRVRPEHLRPLRHLRRLLDPGPGIPRHRHRRGVRPQALNDELEKIEKPAGINPKDFRNEIVNFVLRARANNAGKNPSWTSYEKLRTVIEKKMFSNTEELLPVISFNAKASAEDAKKHETSSPHGGEGLHRQAGAPAVRVVSARAQVVADVGPASAEGATAAQLSRRHLLTDHRPTFAGQEQVRRQPRALLRRYKAQIKDAVGRAIKGRSITDVENGEKSPSRSRM